MHMMNSKYKSKWRHVDHLKYDVIGRNGQVLLKAGTPDVSIAFRCGCFTYVNDVGDTVRANKYRDSMGRIYYGH